MIIKNVCQGESRGGGRTAKYSTLLRKKMSESLTRLTSSVLISASVSLILASRPRDAFGVSRASALQSSRTFASKACERQRGVIAVTIARSPSMTNQDGSTSSVLTTAATPGGTLIFTEENKVPSALHWSRFATPTATKQGGTYALPRKSGGRISRCLRLPFRGGLLC